MEPSREIQRNHPTCDLFPDFPNPAFASLATNSQQDSSALLPENTIYKQASIKKRRRSLDSSSDSLQSKRRRGRPKNAKGPDRTGNDFVQILPRDEAKEDGVIQQAVQHIDIFSPSDASTLFPSYTTDNPAHDMSMNQQLAAMAGQDGLLDNHIHDQQFFGEFSDLMDMTGESWDESWSDYTMLSPPQEPVQTSLKRQNKQADPRVTSIINPEKEVVTHASFLANYNNIVTLDNVFFSLRHDYSIMWEDTLKLFGFEPARGKTVRPLNPQGGVFNPIGESCIYMWFGHQRPSQDRPVLVDFLVLPGSPDKAGVIFILGKSDIRKIFGSDWTPERHIAMMEPTARHDSTLDTALGIQ
ncbi:hypothetical protein B0T26DRAFT_407549 [Lasiosphaeria miniovina]|uniref:Uncharacterized protein n=1 Tax=Lasiosphaeria miniovina TaxID=1954250 RepID=A0AA40A545_9PEZI|nr:uncharacterized protein B0T26DRAFT_407549 [Lasiosphaeria miniovina]KAK0709479.1 hypothetical protein B0T26DRAFT_407549 [Lasiosphaeria miniovina]